MSPIVTYHWKVQEAGCQVDRTCMAISAQSLTTVLYWDVTSLPHTGPTLTRVDTVGLRART